VRRSRRRVQEALGQLVGAAKGALLALLVEVGLGVLRELLEQEVDQLVGPKGKWNHDRIAVRHGTRAERSRSVGGGCRSSGRGRGLRTASQRCRLRAASISPIATSSATWCWSGCSPASRPAGTAVRRSRLVRRSRQTRVRLS
jgi:hypothetical protein